MAVGISTTTLTAILNTFRSTTAYTPPGTGVFVQLHTTVGDPGTAGTANVSAVTSRQAVTFAIPANDGTGMSITMNGTAPSFTMTTSETIRYISLWSAATSGTFLQSAQLTADVPVVNGSVLNFGTLTLKFDPRAA